MGQKVRMALAVLAAGLATMVAWGAHLRRQAPLKGTARRLSFGLGFRMT